MPHPLPTYVSRNVGFCRPIARRVPTGLPAVASVALWVFGLGAIVATPWGPGPSPVRAAEAPLEAGFAKIDITPDLKGDPVWMAGFGNGRRALSVHDPLYARAVVLQQGDQRIAIIAVDLIGFMYPDTVKVRAGLPEFRYVMTASTHNHEGPDTIGLWGKTNLVSGVNPAYMAATRDKMIAVAKTAAKRVKPANAVYGSAESLDLLSDSRLPIVKDGVLRALKFTHADGTALGILVQWNCHPENLGRHNTALTADFPWATVQALEAAHKCPVVYVTGAIGGLMSAPERKLLGAAGKPLEDGEFEFAEVYGKAVAALADSALRKAEPIRLTPFRVFAKPIPLPMTNPLYKLARTMGVLEREAYLESKNPQERTPLTAENRNKDVFMETETAYLNLGELHVAAIPGELYPELVNGAFQDPPEANADFPDAPKEPTVLGLLPGPKRLIIGLANDEVGYIIPKRQWDEVAPFAYGRKTFQYGEVNSVGPQAAPVLMNALRDRVQEANPGSPPTKP